VWIKQAIVKNVGPLEHCDVSFQQGLVGIFGFNGAGKSTLVNSIYAALTNDFKRFPGEKLAAIRMGSSPDSESSILVVAEHNGEEFSVFRCLRPPPKKSRRDPAMPSHELVYGGQKYTSEPAIRKLLEERLGVNNKLIGSYVFVDQWQMFEFISQTEGVRAATYQNLCGTQKAEDIYQAIGEFAESELAGLGDAGLVDNSDQLRQQISEMQGRLVVLQQEQKNAALSLLTKTDMTRYMQLVDAADRRAQVVEELQRFKVSIDAKRADRDEKQKVFARKNYLLSQANELSVTLREQGQAARAFMLRVIEARETAELRKETDARITALKHNVNVTRVPALHPEDANRDALIAERSTLLSNAARSQNIVDTFEDSHLAECPTCGTTTDKIDLKPHHAVIRKADEYGNQLTGLIEFVDVCRRNVREYEQWLNTINHEIGVLEEKLKSLGEGQLVEGSQEDARQAILDMQAHEVLLRKLNVDMTAAKSALDIANGRLESDVNEHGRLGGIYHSIVAQLKDVDLASVRHVLDLHQQASGVVAGLEGRMNEIVVSLNNTNRQLASLTTRLERGQKTRNLIDQLTAIREQVFHRTKLPQAVALANLRRMEKSINSELEQFGSPFWAETSSDLSFIVHRPGIPGFPAAKLSGGMKGVLAIAFRTSLTSLFGDLGMMSLDEPTAGMDVNNVSFLAGALQSYAVKVRGRRQVILISHNRELIPSFDQVIEVGNAA